jgi:hypothetical protein
MPIVITLFFIVSIAFLVVFSLQSSLKMIYLLSVISFGFFLIAQLLLPLLFNFSEDPIWVIEPVFGFWYTVNNESLIFLILRDVLGLEFTLLLPDSILDFIVINIFSFGGFHLLLIKEDNITKLKFSLLFAVGVAVAVIVQFFYGIGAHDFLMFADGKTAFIFDVRDLIFYYILLYSLVIDLKRLFIKA